MFVFVEVALAVVLVVAAGLVTRTLMHLMGADPGFDSNHVVMGCALRDHFRRRALIRAKPGAHPADTGN
jgi:hypothetical protein